MTTRYSLTINTDSENDITRHVSAFDAVTALKGIHNLIVNIEETNTVCSGAYLRTQFEKIVTDLGLKHLL